VPGPATTRTRAFRVDAMLCASVPGVNPSDHANLKIPRFRPTTQYPLSSEAEGFLQQLQRFGDPGTTRTPNILIRSQVLYPVELRDRDSSDSGSGNSSQHACTFLTSCLSVFILSQSWDLGVGYSIQLNYMVALLKSLFNFQLVSTRRRETWCRGNPPIFSGCIRRTYAAIFSFIAGVMPPMPRCPATVCEQTVRGMLGRSVL
jgi:hypothetical protein